jgi:hypothetical protein
MGRSYLLVALILAVALAFPGWALAQNPVRWSAPLSAYPSPWTPTMPPPTPANQAGQSPYWGYGYSPAAYQPYSGSYPGGYPAYPQGGFSGNPYVQPYAP